MVQVLRLRVVPLEDSVGPPLTSKVLKFCLEGVVPKRILGGFSNVSISMLFDGGTPLYSTDESSGPVVLRAGRVYSARVSVVDSSTALLDRVPELSQRRCLSPYGAFELAVTSVDVVPLASLGEDLPEVFRVSFLTPTILSSKLMSPPPLAGRLEPMHKLVPQPSLIFSHLLRMWNSLAPPELRLGKPSEWAPYLLGRQADLVLAELDYRLKPVTAIVGRDESGRLRRTRGFVGWVLYRSTARPRLARILGKLLSLAELVGVGRSRGIGFGHVDVLRQPPRPRGEEGPR